MHLRVGAAAFGLAFLLGLPAATNAEGLTIAHEPVGCVIAERFSAVEARFEPALEVARARVYFHAEGDPNWYFVEMKPAAQTFRGVLPKPKKSLKRLSYYVEATDRELVPARTSEHSADVVASAGVCGGRLMAASVAGASSVVVGVVGQAASLPAGFSGVSAGTAAAGGGLVKTGLIVGGVGAVAAAAAVVASQAAKDDTGNQSGCGGSLTVVERSATTLTLQWSFRAPSPENCYTVDYLTDVPSCSSFPQHGNVQEVAGTTLTLAGLSPATQYHIHVHPLTGCPRGRTLEGSSNVVYVRTLSAGAGPQPVSPSDYQSCCGGGR